MTDNHDLYLLCARQREELRLLNRALNRKNRKLKAQYDELHRQKKTPKPNSGTFRPMHGSVISTPRPLRPMYIRPRANTGVFDEPHCDRHERFEGEDCLSCQDALEAQRKARRDFAERFRPDASADFSKLGPSDKYIAENNPLPRYAELMRNAAHGFRFLVNGEPVVFCAWVGSLGSVIYRGRELPVVEISELPTQERRVRAIDNGGVIQFVVPKEAFR